MYRVNLKIAQISPIIASNQSFNKRYQKIADYITPQTSKPRCLRVTPSPESCSRLPPRDKDRAAGGERLLSGTALVSERLWSRWALSFSHRHALNEEGYEPAELKIGADSYLQPEI